MNATPDKHKYLCSVYFADTEHGATFSRGWWEVVVEEIDETELARAEQVGIYINAADKDAPRCLRVVGRVPSREDRRREGKVFLTDHTTEEVQQEALDAARRFFPAAAGIQRGEYGYDVFSDEGEVKS